MANTLEEKILNTLRESGKIDTGRLDAFLKEVRRKKEAVTLYSLAENGLVSDKELLIAISKETDIPPIDMSRVMLSQKNMGLIPERVLKRHCVAPLSRIGQGLSLVVSDPTDILAIDDVKTVTGMEVDLVLATRQQINDAIGNYFEKGEKEISSLIEEEGSSGGDVEVLGAGEDFDVSEIAKESETAPIVRIVALAINEGMKRRASDIHIEPQEKSVRIRYRIDGELQEGFDLPKRNQNAILARLKIMSNMDITENRVPQDGRFRIKLEDKEIDFRVSALPITYGNKMVLRALDKSNLSLGLETLGFLPEPLADFKKALERPYGIILVTGPTGSGKSTTLYSILNEMNVPERNIITVEDPVEYQVEGITQIAARPDIGLDFASGLRAILRQSPDVIMVGEIRDRETADIAIKASLTGQMVLSTLHTNDAVGAITRLINMGVEPFLVASSLVLTCAQRLLRRICPKCKSEDDIPREVIEKLAKEYPDIRKVDAFFKGTGCEACGGTGYRGRLGTLETILMDDTLKEMVIERRQENEIREYLKSRGFRTLRDNGMIKFMKGWTTLQEVLRVT
jgi:type IV pilus assembly protein PilB